MQKITIAEAQKLSKTSTEVITWRPDCINQHVKYQDIPADMNYATVGIPAQKEHK